MRVVAVLANKEHPELGAISIPIPIRAGEYSSVMKMLSALGIGDVTARDCQIEELTRACPTFRKLEGTEVNIDELDYLAKRLDGFDAMEITQFQAMADKLNLTEIKDLINLTFSCQQATVITDFSDLEAVGRKHYMNTHGGLASMEEMDHLDGEETAILLIEDNEGIITRYGVVYDNGMQLSQLYDGRNLPCYHYESDIDVALDFRHEDIYKLNDLAKCVEKLSNNDRVKLGAVVSLAGPKRAEQVCRLIDNLALFEFAPGAHTPAEYGRFMIQESGHFEYDSNLDEYYDYERCGLQQMEYKPGVFTNRGFIAYLGTKSLEELMAADSEQTRGVMEMQ